MKPIIRIAALVVALLVTVVGFNFIASAADSVVQAGQTQGYEIVVHGGPHLG